MLVEAHMRGSAEQGKRTLPTQSIQQQQQQQQQQETQEHPSQFTPIAYQQSLLTRPSGDVRYQEPEPSPPFEESQQSLPSITSLLGNVQQSEPSQSSDHRRSLSKAQSSPNIHVQTRQSRSPYPGASLRRSQGFSQSLTSRRESALSQPQTWRDDPQQHDPYMSQPSYPMETQQQRQAPPIMSPVRTAVQPPYISPQETPTTQGFEFPYYQQEPAMGQIMPTHSQNPFYPPPPTTPSYLQQGTEMTVPAQYPFTPITSQLPSSGISYVGDTRAMLQGRAVSMGALRGPQRIGASPQEEDKRRRAASASARFRRRKKEQEEENLKEINRLEKKIEDLKKEYSPSL
jgi:hypothetical protein